MNIFLIILALIALAVIAGGIYMFIDCLKEESYIPTESEDEKFFSSIDEAAQFMYDYIQAKRAEGDEQCIDRSLEELKKHVSLMTGYNHKKISKHIIMCYLNRNYGSRQSDHAKNFAKHLAYQHLDNFKKKKEE